MWNGPHTHAGYFGKRVDVSEGDSGRSGCGVDYSHDSLGNGFPEDDPRLEIRSGSKQQRSFPITKEALHASHFIQKRKSFNVPFLYFFLSLVFLFSTFSRLMCCLSSGRR